jgi:hypothetical protein
MGDTLKLSQLDAPDDGLSVEQLVHLVIDPHDGPLCDPTEPVTSTNDPHKMTCERCRRIWMTGTADG